MAAVSKTVAENQGKVEAPSPTSSVQCTQVRKRGKKRTHEDTSKLDSVLEAMVRSANARSASMDQLRQEICGRHSNQEIDPFYAIIASRAQKLSATARAWLENRIFMAYREAERMDAASSQPQYQHSTCTVPQQMFQPHPQYHSPAPLPTPPAHNIEASPETDFSTDESRGGFGLLTTLTQL